MPGFQCNPVVIEMSEGRLQGKVCVVTGATGGIGEAIAELFAEQGGKVVVSGRNTANGDAIVERIRSAGNAAEFIRCDVSEDVEMDALMQGCVERYGGLDVLVNNAAEVHDAHGPGRDVASLPPEIWDRHLRVNLRSVYYLCRLAIPLFRERSGGAIVNISSVGSMVAWPNGAAYLSSKGALNQLTRSMAVDYSADNIRVNALCPGWIGTQTELDRIAENPQSFERVKDLTGIQRMGEPREMAFAALFLACDESSYVTGTALLADGGWTLQ